MSMKIRVVVYDEYPPINLTFKETLVWMESLYNLIPESYRDSANIDFDPLQEYGDSFPNIRVTYFRDATEQEELEIAERKRQEEIAELDRLTDVVARLKKVVGK